MVDISKAMTSYVSDLHRRKNAAYGDSWRRRGEFRSILPNIDRKVDRLGQNDDDETALDTAIDLLVYSVKYLWWLKEQGHSGEILALPDEIPESEDDRVDLALRLLQMHVSTLSDRTPQVLIDEIRHFTDNVWAQRMKKTPGYRVAEDVEQIVLRAYRLSLREWWKAGNRSRFFSGYEGGSDD